MLFNYILDRKVFKESFKILLNIMTQDGNIQRKEQ